MSDLPLWSILVPLIGGALALLAERRRYGMAPQRAIAWTSLAAQLVIACLLVRDADSGRVLVYLLGDWPARLGISLMVDRLSAMMVLVATLLAIACLLHACAGWDRRAPHFHAFFQLQLMGLNGAFLTGDLFNLFVFFEVLLSASYGLLLSGGRSKRMRAGFHYVTANIAASTVFLMALGLLYGLLGTLNMAEMATRIAQAPAADHLLIQAAAGLLLLVFCVKAAMLPVYFWLPDTYTHAPAPVAALFAVMTKVGLYALLRVCSLLFGATAGDLAGFAWPWLLVLGTLTLALASLGVMAAIKLRALAAYLVLASAATLILAFATERTQATGAGLYYLAHSSFAGAALFLIADLVRRRRGEAGDRNDRVQAITGRTLPGAMFLIAAISLAGLPPLSGFVGKFALLTATIEQRWIWLALLISSFLMLVGLTRAGTRLFWRVEPAHAAAADAMPPPPAPAAPARRLETLATILLLAYGVAMTIAASPLLAYTSETARQLQSPGSYIEQVRQQPPVMR